MPHFWNPTGFGWGLASREPMVEERAEQQVNSGFGVGIRSSLPPDAAWRIGLAT